MAEHHPPDVIPFDIVELNTMSDPSPGFRDETGRVWCARCGHRFLNSFGMIEWSFDPVVSAERQRRGDRIRTLTRMHLELCEGDAPTTLMKIEQAYKAGTLRLP